MSVCLFMFSLAHTIWFFFVLFSATQVGLRHGEEWCGRGSDGCDAPRAGDEKYRSSRHGGYFGHLRPDYSCHHFHGHQPDVEAVLLLRWIRAPRVRTQLRSCGSWSRYVSTLFALCDTHMSDVTPPPLPSSCTHAQRHICVCVRRSQRLAC